MSQEVKDFQRATADRILHIYKNLGHRRVLLADEVGLGKTFVAKQVINLVREWHKQEKDDFFKVVYICSNANIADQNIEKLGVENRMSISESRLSMQHLYIKLAEKQIAKQHEKGEMPESIIPLTPSTSFRFYSAQGTANERALMCDILCGLTQFKDYKEVISNFLSCNVKNWQELIHTYNYIIGLCGEDYLREMHGKLQTILSDTIINQLIEYAQTGCDNRQRADMINKLRRIFAEISIDMLDPDLVIMDEFQRFNSLLEQGDDEQSMLANKFFDDKRSNTKILLLSATPYKPYSTLEELNTNGNDEHYQDFMKVMDFLYATKDKADRFKLIWHTYSAALKRTDVVDLTPLVVTKNEAEEALYGVMCRTERFNSGIIDDSRVCDVQVVPEDILSFAEGQYLMDCLNQENTKVHLGNLPMEYVKSSPYLLSFMDKYELKKRIASALQHSDVKRYGKMDALLLSKYAINNYRPIPAANGKLKYLHDLVFGTRHEKKTQLLLWVPASNPYYKAGGVFESNEARNFSKIILFSSWEMVPRMISIMMSYYSELYTLGELKKVEAEIRYTSQKKNRYGENRLRADGLLEYPCRILSGLFSPTTFYGEKLSSIRKIIKQRIQEEFTQNTIISSIPQQGRNNAKLILTIMKILDGKPVEDLNDLYVPSNALDVMTDIAIASPAVCAYRQSGNEEDAQMVAKAIVSVFNKPESAAVIDLMYNKKNDDDYYESVLDYCVVGNLQAVLDEYAHMTQTKMLGHTVTEAIIGTSNLSIDTTDSLGMEEKKQFMRCHFAIPFIDKTVTDKSVARTTNIRKAFNSPFRPFLLSTTSIGQEGLDFHWYARKIVHWNLPSNPVDLEQREGRINRFKCLAIRRNVVKLYGNETFHTWDELFSMAYSNLKGMHSDIVPYWCLPVAELTEEQRAKLEYIERIVPLYPLSRDRYKYERLIKVLALYRMTLGQPRQEELLNLLKNMHLSDEQLKKLTIDLCPYNKRK
ncbi:DEAD/DEAH box helicase [Bacteroides gallinaceum]|uniref:DEAD/DEAH box helicase n=1 Tax=Bacteroides gallinaceum TaxID=1462571 RepID=UPI00195A37D7|nr:DEAD/DEAH box helicase [Bacteroides gallinaceum]MBM6657643.1 DEAD/DEAH box helicase family protein [Bacteroides gallinaceum]